MCGAVLSRIEMEGFEAPPTLGLDRAWSIFAPFAVLSLDLSLCVTFCSVLPSCF